MNNFTLEANTRVYFGTHIVEEALIKEKNIIENRNVMIVTTGGALIEHGYLEQLVKWIKNLLGKGSIVVYDNISKNPKLIEVKNASEAGRENNVQLVIGFGGGSAIDAAKAVAAGIPVENKTLNKFLLEGMEPKKPYL
jgi:alcohol dehydrogenase class IV